MSGITSYHSAFQLFSFPQNMDEKNLVSVFRFLYRYLSFVSSANRKLQTVRGGSHSPAWRSIWSRSACRSHRNPRCRTSADLETQTPSQHEESRILDQNPGIKSVFCWGFRQFLLRAANRPHSCSRYIYCKIFSNNLFLHFGLYFQMCTWEISDLFHFYKQTRNSHIKKAAVPLASTSGTFFLIWKIFFFLSI